MRGCAAADKLARTANQRREGQIVRIAFASCMYNRVMADQPVWDWIAAQAPDHLLLLGDSLYLDLMTAEHPQTLDDDGFARHLYQLYSELIAQPQFAALVRALPPRRVHAIWDDHDFLWNDACGAELRTVQGGKIRLSTAFLEAFRLSLRHRLDPDSFPGSYDAPAFWNLAQPPLSTPSLDLGEGVLLHLSDGRTHRTRSWLLAEARRSLLGREQMQALGTVIAQAPAETVHLFASGSTLAGYQRYARDLAWLHGLAATHRLLVLSGDIHRNQLDLFRTAGLLLHEATSSGAGVRDAVVAGAARQNYGLLDIGPEALHIRLFKKNRLELERRIDRTSWNILD
jgi:alkaline phosphatase D